MNNLVGIKKVFIFVAVVLTENERKYEKKSSLLAYSLHCIHFSQK